jgi:hypothetical protein
MKTTAFISINGNIKKLSLLFVTFFFILNSYAQKVEYYAEGEMGADNLKFVMENYSGWLHSFGTRYEGIKGSPNLFNNFGTSFILFTGQEKYIPFESDIDLLRNALIFKDPSTGQLNEIPSDIIKELVFEKYDKQFIYRTTKGLRFENKMKENKFYQVIKDSPYRLIMITYKNFKKADSEPVFNSGQHHDEFRSDRKFYVEDSKGIFHHVILNKLEYDYILHPSQLDKKEMAKIFPDKKEIIYKEFELKPDSVSVERVISVLNKF